MYVGTGKSVTGAHLAYASIVANTSDSKFVPSSNEKIKCVMYCGPSNKSVDVVLGMSLRSSLTELYSYNRLSVLTVMACLYISSYI